MARFRALLGGELRRLRRYRLLSANLVLLLVWMLLAAAMDEALLRAFLPFVLLLDAAMMSLTTVGVTIFYERRERAASSILVSPVTADEYFLAKVAAGVLSSLLTLLVVALGTMLIARTALAWAPLIPAVAVVAACHTVLGIALGRGAVDFTAVVLRGVAYMFVLLLPAVFGLFGLIGPDVLRYLLVLPAQSSARLISTGFTAVDPWEVVVGYLYLPLLTAAVYVRAVRPAFGALLVREAGV
jgi:hypothetical protein